MLDCRMLPIEYASISLGHQGDSNLNRINKPKSNRAFNRCCSNELKAADRYITVQIQVDCSAINSTESFNLTSIVMWTMFAKGQCKFQMYYSDNHCWKLIQTQHFTGNYCTISHQGIFNTQKKTKLWKVLFHNDFPFDIKVWTINKKKKRKIVNKDENYHNWQASSLGIAKTLHFNHNSLESF